MFHCTFIKFVVTLQPTWSFELLFITFCDCINQHEFSNKSIDGQDKKSKFNVFCSVVIRLQAWCIIIMLERRRYCTLEGLVRKICYRCVFGCVDTSDTNLINEHKIKRNRQFRLTDFRVFSQKMQRLCDFTEGKLVFASRLLENPQIGFVWITSVDSEMLPFKVSHFKNILR